MNSNCRIFFFNYTKRLKQAENVNILVSPYLYTKSYLFIKKLTELIPKSILGGGDLVFWVGIVAV